MVTRARFPGAASFVPADHRLGTLAAAARHCEGCDLYQRATQTVFGLGPPDAAIMLVGEQPGDAEDTAGEPFVGPAGRLLDRALADAHIDRAAAYVTNAVKHFRWKSTDHGPRRLHEKPATAHLQACRPWLAAELGALQPQVIVALGATASESLLGRGFRLTERRGQILDWTPDVDAFGSALDSSVRGVVATIHPSAVLRADKDRRAQAYDGLVADLRMAATVVDG
ncbi:MAG: UdgX family uracil-DNA binding protein [Actinobacteria bacterium]|nr:UdgX family uracil-DNA binding protein [Actinomycetota bacterium]